MDVLDALQTFTRIVETGSLSGAARSRRRSLPAISRQLRALESAWSAELVLRTTRKLRVTEAGQRLYERSSRILAEIERARVDAGGKVGLHGRLVVSAGVTIGTGLFGSKVAAWVKRHTGVQVDLRLEDRTVDLITDGVDIAIRGGMAPPDSTSVSATKLTSFTRVLVAAPGYVRSRRALREPGELSRHDVLLQSSPGVVDGSIRLLSGAETRDVRVASRFACSAPLGLLQAAEAGVGIALLPEWLVADSLKARRCVRVLPTWHSHPVDVWAICRTHDRRTPRVRSFIEALT